MNNDPSTSSSALLRMFILDVLRHDEIEDINGILKLINDDGCIGWRWTREKDFKRKEIVPVLIGLINAKSIDLCKAESPSGPVTPVDLPEPATEKDLHNAWYHLTSKGLKQWEQWDPPIQDGI